MEKQNNNIIDNEYFYKQVEIGEANEHDFAAFLKLRGWLEIIVTEGNFSKYDIEAFKGCSYETFEIKTNSGIDKYKTAFFEVTQSGKPSGLATTEATWQVHYSESGQCRFFSTSEAKHYIKDNHLRLVDTSWVTQSGKVSGQGYKIPWKDLHYIKG